MSEEKSLRRYIIRKFIFILIIAGAAEFLLLDFINHFFMPIIIKNFFPQLAELQIFSIGTLVLLALFVILYLLSLLVDSIVPLSSFFLGLLARIMGISVSEYTDSPLMQLSTGQFLLLMIVLIVILFLVSLPLFLGAFVFARTVARKFRSLEELHERERRDAEHKRYLIISDIAHDLKTPMTTVSGYAKALSDGVVSPSEQKEYLDAICAKTDRMSEIIQMLFNYVRLDSDGYELVKSSCDLCEVVREVCSAEYSVIEDGGCELVANIPEEIIKVDIDKVQFARVISNLITNAVKHNPSGTKIGVTVRNEYDDIRVFIADSGVAIPDELASHLFEPFVMGDESRSTGGGSGLGLSVAKKICDMHGFKLNLVQGGAMARYRLGEEFKKVFVVIIGVG